MEAIFTAFPEYFHENTSTFRVCVCVCVCLVWFVFEKSCGTKKRLLISSSNDYNSFGSHPAFKG